MFCVSGSLFGLYGQTYRTPSFAQDSADLPDNYWDDIDGFLDRQSAVGLSLVEKVLYRFSPVYPEQFERKLALVTIDCILHYEAAPQLPSVQRFYHSRMVIALEGLKHAKVDNGCIVWKLYDHGFIVRTATVTVAFDLTRGYSSRAEGFPVSDDLMKEMVGQCDVLFISHRHGDHADETVAQLFLDQHKPVIAPIEVWQGKPIHRAISHIRPDPHKLQEIPLREEKPALNVVIYPGHQGENVQNNVYLVITSEGLSFGHTGDQSNIEDFSWIDHVKDHHHVDILMVNCWTTDINRLARGFDAALIITGHENELGHTIDHREPYWLTYDRMENVGYPYLLMTWGESFDYEVPDSKPGR